MKKLVSILLIVLFTIILCSCNNAFLQKNAEEQGDITHPSSEKFLNNSEIQVFDDWIYYFEFKNDLRRCKKDLTQDTLIAKNVNDFYIKDSILFYNEYPHENSQYDHYKQGIFQIDLKQEQLKIDKIMEIQNEDKIYYPLFYQNNIFYTEDQNDKSVLIICDKEKKSKEVIADDIINYGLVDNDVYYHSYKNEDSIMKYNIKSKETEVFAKLDYEFSNVINDDVKNSLITVEFIDRTIFVYPNSLETSKYINIDEKIWYDFPDNNFDLSKYEDGEVNLLSYEDGVFYFILSESYVNSDNYFTEPVEFYKFILGMEKPQFLGYIDNPTHSSSESEYIDAIPHTPYLIDNNIYYIDDKGNINKIELKDAKIL